jgi:hypothetical protein
MKKEFEILIMLLLLPNSLIFQGCLSDDKDILIIGELEKQNSFDMKNAYLQLIPLSEGQEPVIRSVNKVTGLDGVPIMLVYDSNYPQLTPISDGKFTYRVQKISAGKYFLGISRLVPKFERTDDMGPLGSEFARCIVDEFGKNIILDFKTDTTPPNKIILGKVAVPLVKSFFVFTDSFYNFTHYEIKGHELSKRDGIWDYKDHLNSDQPAKKISAAKYIAETGQYGQDDIDALIACLKNVYRADEVKLFYNGGEAYTTPSREAKKALIRIGSQAVDKLVLLFKKESEGVSYQIFHQFSAWSISTEILAAIGDKKALPAMIQLLEEKPIYLKNKYFLETFPIAVAKVGGNDAFDPLLKAYQAAKIEEQLEIERKLIYSLGLTGDNRFIPFAREIIQSNDQKRGTSALYALQFFNDNSTFEFVVTVLENEDPGMRITACFVLGKLKRKEALGPLRELKAKEHNVNVQYKALEAISILEKL